MFQINVIPPNKIPAFPRINIGVGEIELSLIRGLPENIDLLIGFVAKNFTELNQTIQKCFLILNLYGRFYQECESIIVRDYMGRTIFEAL